MTLSAGDEVTDGGVFAGIVVQADQQRGRVSVVWSPGEGRYSIGHYSIDAAARALAPTGKRVPAREALELHNGYLRSRGLPERTE